MDEALLLADFDRSMQITMTNRDYRVVLYRATQCRPLTAAENMLPRRFEPGETHWHGAGPGTAMTHIAIQESLDGKAVEWLEKVSDADYGAAS
jgi:hypothetical protein